MAQIRLKVGGMEYAINSEDDETYVRSIGSQLDRRLDQIAKKSPFLSTTMVAVIAALEAYDEARKAQAENEKLRLEMKQLLEESAMAKMSASAANRRIEELSEKLAEAGASNDATQYYVNHEEVADEENDVDEEEITEDKDIPDETYEYDEDVGADAEFSDEDNQIDYRIEEDESGQYGFF